MRRPPILRASFVAVALCLLVPTAHAAWTPNGIQLFDYYQGFGPFQMTRDLSGLLVRVPYGTGFHTMYRVDPQGEILWERASSGQTPTDLYGNHFMVYAPSPGDVAAALIDADNVPVWPSDVLLFSGTTAPTAAAPIIGGELYVARREGTDKLRVKRVFADGTVPPDWPASGVDISYPSSVNNDPQALGMGANGVIVAWGEDASFGNFTVVERVGSDGVPRFGGLPVTDDETVPGVVLALEYSEPDHFYCIWARDVGTREIRVQRLAVEDGALAPGWPISGIVVVNGKPTSFVPQVTSDGVDGLLFAWRDGAVVRGLRLLSDGTLAPGWPAAGLSLLDAGAVLPAGSGDFFVATEPGRTFVAWSDRRGGVPTVRLRWLLADGTADPNHPADGRNASPTPVGTPTVRGIVEDGNGGAYVGWTDNVTPPTHSPYRVTWMPGTGVLSSPVPSRGASLALAAPWPNPARDGFSVRFALDGSEPARIDLVDVAGQRVRSRVVTGAGQHVERFDGLAGIAAGVYFVRVEQAGRMRSTRVAIVR